MCGIAGFIDPSRDRDTLEAMTAAIARRGPDDFGHHYEGGVALGHRRLSIIDLSPLGHQPMRFESLLLVYNGEIYNYAEVARDLAAQGYSFTSHSDSEVLIKAFHCWGPRCVERFVGMFAFAVYDEAERALYLVRDRAGVKPLYYYEKDGRIAFGSTLYALRPYLSPEERTDIDPDALSEYLTLGYVGSGASILRPVRKLPAAHYLKFAGGRSEVHRYWNVEFVANDAWRGRSEDDLVDELEAIAVSAFKYRMVADVPVGVFLSGGVDSSLVTAILARHHGRLSTFTIGFNEPDYDESAAARRIAQHLGTDHHEAVLTHATAETILEDFYEIYDEPHGDGSCIPTSFVSGLAKANGMKVVLSADAGDELFGGYVRYTEFMRRWEQTRRLGRVGRGAARAAAASLAALAPARWRGRLNRYAELFGEQSFIHFSQTSLKNGPTAELGRIFPAYREHATGGGPGDLLAQLSEWDFKRYMVDDLLVKVDRATMYHSIEGREPFLDHRLVEFAAQLPTEFKIRGGDAKYLLKKLLGRYLSEPLFRLPKKGFAAPLNDWVRDSYHDRFIEVLSGGETALFDRRHIAAMLARYRAGKPVNYTLLWFLFSFHLWYAKWIR
ncbi:MAG: asparagine synthase (glutamine-hydrolyzing) [Alphaproteobacteria bacterium]|nr:asparagine synthase (glutamine-hydrolyzing) [Alphaproteobacteria bacterium]